MAALFPLRSFSASLPWSVQIGHIVLLKDTADPSKMRNYCFVHFEERSSAVRAVDEATDGPKPEMDGKELSVSGVLECALQMWGTPSGVILLLHGTL